jgi:hypothetical protein
VDGGFAQAWNVVSEPFRGWDHGSALAYPESSDIVDAADALFELPLSSPYLLATWINSHLSLQVLWDGTKAIDVAATNPKWSKWRPSDPTSPHWYTPARLERLMAACVGLDEDNGRRDRTKRESVSEFRGLSGSAKQRLVLAEVDASRTALSAFFGNGEVDRHVSIGCSRL